MSLDKTKFTRATSSGNSSGPIIHSYNGGADSLATILTANYFLGLNNDGNPTIRAGDFVFISTTSGGSCMAVFTTASSTSVATAACTPVALFGSTTWDAGSIGNGNEEAKEVTVTGAALGDLVIASMSLDVADLAITATVTAANTVTAQLMNNTGGSIDLASATLRVMVFKAPN